MIKITTRINLQIRNNIFKCLHVCMYLFIDFNRDFSITLRILKKATLQIDRVSNV